MLSSIILHTFYINKYHSHDKQPFLSRNIPVKILIIEPDIIF